jgi:hypothetical protein
VAFFIAIFKVVFQAALGATVDRSVGQIGNLPYTFKIAAYARAATVDENSGTRSAHSPILGTGEPWSGVLRKDRPEHG